jgi:hypothetical protein
MQFGVGQLDRWASRDLANAKKCMAGARQDVLKGISELRTEKSAIPIWRLRVWVSIYYYKCIFNNYNSGEGGFEPPLGCLVPKTV